MEKIYLVLILILNSICGFSQNSEDVNWFFLYDFFKLQYSSTGHFTTEKIVQKNKEKIIDLSNAEITELLEELALSTKIEENKEKEKTYKLTTYRKQKFGKDLELQRFLSLKKISEDIECTNGKTTLFGPLGANYNIKVQNDVLTEEITSSLNFNKYEKGECQLNTCEIEYSIKVDELSFKLTSDHLGKEINLENNKIVVQDTFQNKLLIRCTDEAWKEFMSYKHLQLKNDTTTYRTMFPNELKSLGVDDKIIDSVDQLFGSGDYSKSIHNYFKANKDQNPESFKLYMEALPEEKRTDINMHVLSLYKPLEQSVLVFKKDKTLNKSIVVKMDH